MRKEELNHVLRKFNDTKVDYPRDVCLHQLFEIQALRNPNSVAVVFENSRLTYSELNQRANQLAHYLQENKVGPEVPVGVMMERSLELVVALYGILKAGGAYVPLDPEYPRERLAFMLEDTHVPILLTLKRWLTELPPHNAKVISLDMDWARIARGSTNNPSSGIRAENLAYIIYTSGSTGKPKGVMNCHRGICNRLLWMQDAFKLNETDRVIQKTPFSFDVSIWEFFWPLLSGAKMIVARPGGHKDTNYLVNLINQEGITTIHFVPSMLQLFLEDKQIPNCPSLRRVICSGEALSYDLQKRFFALLDAELHNLYGPTEAAVDVTHWACKRDSGLDFVPIGRPIANTQIYLLDGNLKPVQISAPGELYIGGVQVARGYVNRPDLTKEHFIPDPFSDEPGARLYRTGDLACYLETGDLKFLGRIDNQVKIRGNRVELGEIEAVLDKHPSLKKSVVLAREDELGEKRLVAYIVAKPQLKPDAWQLRSYLLGKLPDYMIPSAFKLLDEMPLTPTGKVDRRALPKLDGRRPELEQSYVMPRNEVESHLASIWCDILSLDRVGINDRFFELGGTSLKAARFINILQEELGENIYVISIFESPTIAQYAAFLQKNYARALTRKFKLKRAQESKIQLAGPVDLANREINEDMIARMHRCIPSFVRIVEGKDDNRNPPAIFILSPPRSGTTLLRVMLAGHPDLFAASELQLLGFNTLQERRAAFSGKYSLWLEGTIRMIMEVKGYDVEEANRVMEEHEQKNYTTKEFYAVLQQWIGDKVLVDKSPSYALDTNALEKAEHDFRDPLYIHLVRHPYAMIRSFESYHLDQVLFLRDQPFSPRQLGELVWLISHKNISDFLRQIPKHRHYQMRFEDLISKPGTVLEQLCRTLRIRFVQDLLNPYENLEKKMTNGIHKESKPMGDTKFLEHGRINSEVAGAWEGVRNDNFLSQFTWELAASLGYELPEPEKARSEMLLYLRQKRTRGRRQVI